MLARVDALGHRRGTALGHQRGMPPTGANIAVLLLLLKTWLVPDTTYTYQPTVVGLSVGMMARAVLYCCAVLCRAVLLLPFVLLVYAFTEVTKNVVLLPESAPESYQQIKICVLGQRKCPKCLFWEKPYITLVVTSKT